MPIVLFFGPLIDATGVDELKIDATDTTALQHYLKTAYPALSGHSFAVAVNGELIRDTTILNEHDEVALLPPYSGG